MAIYHVSLSFATDSDSELDVFSSNNVICMTGNAAFPAPPVKPVDLGVLQVNFHKTVLNATNGGKQLTALKLEARNLLVAAMRQNAAYVQSLASQSLSMLLSSGYLQTSTNHSQSELDTPAISSIENGATCQLIAHVTPVANAHSYQVKAQTPDGKQVALVNSTQARSVVVPGLTPGIVYTLLACAIGGLAGQSDWSDPVSHMCM
jgi:hypothetical protein